MPNCLLMNVAVVPAYLLSTLYLKPPLFVYFIAGIAALLQLVALGYFLQIITNGWKKISSRISSAMKFLLLMIFLSYILKVGLQLLSAFPSMAEMAYGSRQYTVTGYLHLVMLGFITFGLGITTSQAAGSWVWIPMVGICRNQLPCIGICMLAIIR